MAVLVQWTAEADMRDFCFICGVNSYKFESRSYVRAQLTIILLWFLRIFGSEILEEESWQ